jgi:tRNA nucleotidyltransferase (CCA-adding enzyme)
MSPSDRVSSGAALPPVVLDMARALRDAGGRAFLVGGWVRDLIAAQLEAFEAAAAEDEYDLEAYGLPPEDLRRVLKRFGRVNLVGESFAVYKVSPGDAGGARQPTVDVSLPRRDTKIGRGHRGFEVSGDPNLSYLEATRRRDFTVNAMMYDPLDGETLDLWGGREDLAARRLRAVDPITFIDDSLRVLRAVQFAARFEFDIAPETASLCRSIDLGDLPAERIWGEMEKLLLKARRPSKGLAWAAKLGVIDQLFPELKALMGCQQEPEWHPEGDVWIHTLLAVDRAREEGEGLQKEKKLAVMLAVLCHDFGKPATTSVVDGRIRSYEHEEAGIEPTIAFLDRLKIQTLNGYPLRDQVIELVARHLTPSHWYKNRDNVGDGAVRRLARKLEPELLYLVSRADCLGRTGTFSTDAQEWFIERYAGWGWRRGRPNRS